MTPHRKIAIIGFAAFALTVLAGLVASNVDGLRWHGYRWQVQIAGTWVP